MANNLADIVRCMETVDATKDHLKQMLVQADFGYSSETLKLEHQSVVVDMISRSFADKGDLTTLAHVTYENIAEQVLIMLLLCI